MITRLNNDLDHISRMDTLPNDSAGWTAEQVKAEFDRAANEIKTYINTVLLPFLESVNGAGGIGITPIASMTGAETIQEALVKIQEQMAEMTQGAVADGSITAEKLTNGSVTNDKISIDAVGTSNIVDGAVTADKLASDSVISAKIAALAVITEKLADLCVTTAKIANKAVTTAKIADGAVGMNQLADDGITTDKLTDSVVTAAKIQPNAIEAAKIKNGAVSATYTATIPTGWSGSQAPYSKAVTVSGITASDTPIIDLVASNTFADAEAQLEAWGLVYRAVTAANTITFYATEKPTVAIPVKILCVRK